MKPTRMSSDIKGFGIVVEAQALHCPNSVIDRIKDCRGECEIPYRYCGDLAFLLRGAIALHPSTFICEKKVRDLV